VKQLYKLTNKRNATKQIGTRVRRLERAQASFQRQKLQKKRHGFPYHETSKDNRQSDAADDSDLHYFISPSQNDWFDIYALLKSRSADPAYKVSVVVSHYLLGHPNLGYHSVGLLAKIAGPSPWSPARSRL